MKNLISIIVVFTLSFNMVFSQSRQERNKIKAIIEDFENATDDVYKQPLLAKITEYYKDSRTKDYTSSLLQFVIKPEIDQLIGENLNRIDKITDFKAALTDLKYVNLSQRPYSRFVIQNDLATSNDGGLDPDKELYRKYLFKLLISAKLNGGFSTFLSFYLKNNENITAFNKFWILKETNNLIADIYENDDQYTYYSQKLRNEISKGILQSGMGVNSDAILLLSKNLDEIIFSHQPCRRCAISKLPVISREYEYLKTLTENEINSLLTPEVIAQINSGEISFDENILQLFKNKLCSENNTKIDILIYKYNFYLDILQSIINTKYLSSQEQISTAPINANILSQAPNSCVLTRALGYGFLKRYLSSQVGTKIGNARIANVIVDEAMASLTLNEYGINTNKRIISSISSISSDPGKTLNTIWNNATMKSKITPGISVSNTDLNTLSTLFLNGKMRGVVIKNRSFDLDNYKVIESGRIKRKGWFSKKYTYITDIPSKLRNVIANEGYKALDVIDYSFLERDLNVYLGESRPFFDLIDIVTNNPENCLPILGNSFINKDYPQKFTNTEIREKVLSGSSDDLNARIGLKLGFQKHFVSHNIFADMQKQVATSSIPNDQKTSFLKAFPSDNSLHLDRNFINYIKKDKLDEEKNVIETFYGNTIMYNGNIRVYQTMLSRASGLPVKADCNWYEFFWCSTDRNRRMNDERQKHINVATQKIGDNRNFIKALSYFDILNLRNAKAVSPFFTSFDPEKNSIFCLVKIVDDNGSHILSISNDNLAAASNIQKADMFWTKYDTSYMERYNVDIANISDHGFEYLASLSENFIKENMTDNSLPQRLSQNGYTKCSDVFPEDFTGINKNRFIKNIQFNSYLFAKERRLIDRINSDAAIPDKEAIAKINDVSSATDNKLTGSIAPTINQVNSSYDEAMDKWNEFIIFIGFVNTNGQTIPIIQFNIGSINVAIAIPIFGIPPVFPIPRIF